MKSEKEINGKINELSKMLVKYENYKNKDFDKYGTMMFITHSITVLKWVIE